VAGITGIFGSGKSTVAGIFKSFGADVIDADKLAHKHLLSQTRTYKRIVDSFGESIIGLRGQIDRRKLAKLVFHDKGMLSKLNSIIHPQVVRDIRLKAGESRKRLVILDAPLLLEAGLRRMVDDLIVVVVSKEELIRRLIKKTGLRRAEILRRLRSQIPLRLKKRMADFIIDNNGTIQETRKQVKSIIRKIQGGSCGKTGD